MINRTVFSTYLFYKPYNVLSQFSKDHADHITIADFVQVEKDVYPIGRLDRDSEGLLLLSNDKSLTSKILLPSKDKRKEYYVEVEGEPDQDSLSKLRKGIELRIKKVTFITKPAVLERLKEVPDFPARVPPVRTRLSIPTAWVRVEITEGKNRQVRKMFAAIGFPVLRLIRTRIDKYSLKGMKPGEIVRITDE